MAGVPDARRVVPSAGNRGLESRYLRDLPGLLDSPLSALHLMGVGEKVYEGSRQIRSGQGSYPSRLHGSPRAVVPARIFWHSTAMPHPAGRGRGAQQ